MILGTHNEERVEQTIKRYMKKGEQDRNGDGTVCVCDIGRMTNWKASYSTGIRGGEMERGWRMGRGQLWR